MFYRYLSQILPDFHDLGFIGKPSSRASRGYPASLPGLIFYILPNFHDPGFVGKPSSRASRGYPTSPPYFASFSRPQSRWEALDEGFPRQYLLTSAFTNEEFQHPSVAPIWRYIRELQLSAAGSWSKDELCNAMPRWESLLPKFPPQVIANPVVPFAWHALRAIAEYLSGVCDFAQSLLPAPVWYIMPDQRPYLPHFKLFIVNGADVFGTPPRRLLTGLTQVIESAAIVTLLSLRG
ncbi:hypothetical protein DXG01_001153 [Tephrocybe rancida]|nr:hypothetical protein DXG01_001153 [Tephrocybe rancida]